MLKISINRLCLGITHYSDVMMSVMAFQITSVSIVCSAVCSGADQAKHQSSRHWPLWGESTGDRWFPSQRASNTENVSIWWCYFKSKSSYPGANELICHNGAELDWNRANSCPFPVHHGDAVRASTSVEWCVVDQTLRPIWLSLKSMWKGASEIFVLFIVTCHVWPNSCN